jgi:hypothetical protein
MEEEDQFKRYLMAAIEIQRVFRGYVVRKTLSQAQDEFREIFQ